MERGWLFIKLLIIVVFKDWDYRSHFTEAELKLRELSNLTEDISSTTELVRTQV